MNHYQRIERVIRYLDEKHVEQPDLDTLAKQAGLSPFHFHRLFSAWAGVTPKDFLQRLTLSHARELLRAGRSVLDATYEAGLSGPGRLHDLSVHLEAASPGEIKSGGAGWTIAAGFADSPFGRFLVGEGPRGICHLSFLEPPSEAEGWKRLQSEWPAARTRRDDGVAARLADRIFSSSPSATGRKGRAPLRAFVRGSEFQVRVWQALLRVEGGTLASYGALATAMGNPGASRAVGSAVARNPIAYLIPCHRVIRETGVFGSYRWGASRKRAIVAWESVKTAYLAEGNSAPGPWTCGDPKKRPGCPPARSERDSV